MLRANATPAGRAGLVILEGMVTEVERLAAYVNGASA